MLGFRHRPRHRAADRPGHPDPNRPRLIDQTIFGQQEPSSALGVF
jgi:hypothetical protein